MSIKDTNWAEGIKTFNAGKFAPKLTFQQQCAIFTLHHKYEISINVLSESYGIAPRTVSVLCNRRAKEYRRVKKEEGRLGGLSGMDKEYVFEDDILRVQRTVHGRDSSQKEGRISLGSQEFTITQKEDKWVAFSYDIESELGSFPTFAEARDECIKYAKLSGAI